jgi:hypothetical protein
MPEQQIIPAGISFGGGPRCFGMVLFVRKLNRIERLDCLELATWRKTTVHCGPVRERYLCDQHHDLDLKILSRCQVCRRPVESAWERV